MRWTMALIWALCMGGASAETATPVAFTKKPAATRDGDPSTGSGQGKVKVEFAVSRETDVAVYVENAMGLAAGPDGRLYVLDYCGAWLYWNTSRIHVFRRDGAYEKTIKPFSPTLPLERVKAIGAFTNSFGAVNPIGWIVGLAVTDRFAYVDDVLNKRILRVKLDYAATETYALP